MYYNASWDVRSLNYTNWGAFNDKTVRIGEPGGRYIE